MKKLVLIAAIVISGVWYNTANAQIRVHVGLNFGYPRAYVPARVVVAQPAPAVCEQPANYNEDVSYNDADDYYYLPDVDAYYNVPNQCYYYNNGGAWVSSAYLPGAYRDYDWRSVRHYEVRAPRPFMHNDFYRAKFNGVAFNGRWNDRGYDNHYRQVDYNRGRVAYSRPNFDRGRVAYNRPNFDRGDSRGHNRFDRGDSRHER